MDVATLYNLDAERLILGAVFLNNDLIPQLRARLSGEDFFLQSHAIVWRAMLDLNSNWSAIDPITISDYLKADGDLERIGGMAFIASLISGSPAFTNVDSYVAIVLRYSAARQAIRETQTLSARLNDNDSPPDAVIRESIARLSQIRTSAAAGNWQTAEWAIDRGLERLQDREIGLATGFPDLDRLLTGGGFKRSDLILIGARTSVGKSSFGLCVFSNIHARYPQAVTGYLSLEQSVEGLGARLIAINAEIPWREMARGAFTQSSWQRYQQFRKEAAQWRFRLQYDPRFLPDTIYREADNLKRSEGRLDCLFIDYPGLVQMGNVQAFESRRQEIGYLSRELKAMAGALNCPIVVPVQVNREGAREGIMQLHHLSESGNWEQDADTILLLSSLGQDDDYREIQADLAKQREGMTDTFKLRFLRSCGKFVSVDQTIQ